jgi:hypothetical protein
MVCMFRNSIFNGDISDWDTSKVDDTGWMFSDSRFSGRLPAGINGEDLNESR